jgi:hypothetical protein
MTMLWAYFHGASWGGWEPLTLKGSGLYHLAAGGVIGVSTWTRGIDTALRNKLGASINTNESSK